MFTLPTSRDAPLAIFALALLSHAPASGQIAIGAGELSMRGTIRHEYDSNIFTNNQETGDWHTIVTPELVFARRSGIILLDAQAGLTGHRFANFSEGDSWDPFARGALDWKPEDAKSAAWLAGGYRRTNEANTEINTRIRADEFRADAWFEHFPGERLGYRATGSFFNSDYLERIFSDLRTHAFDVDARYRYSPKYALFAGVGFRASSTYYVPTGLTAMDSTDHRFKIGASGEVLPKVTGRVAAGWVRREPKARAAEGQAGLLFDTSLSWQRDEDTTFLLVVTRDFDTTPFDEMVMRLEISLEARRQVHEKWTVAARGWHVASRFTGWSGLRKDDVYSGRLSADYHLTRRFKAEAGVTYIWSESTRRIADYDRVIVGGALVASF